MEITAFTDLIPKWFEPSGEDWRKLFDGRATYSTLAPRVQLAILITYFHRQFQVRTPDEAYNAFRFSSQRMDETIEDWGKRVDRMVARVQRFGMNLDFGQLLTKWRTGDFVLQRATGCHSTEGSHTKPSHYGLQFLPSVAGEVQPTHLRHQETDPGTSDFFIHGAKQNVIETDDSPDDSSPWEAEEDSCHEQPTETNGSGTTSERKRT